MREKENSKNDIKEEKKQNVLRRSQQLLDGNERGEGKGVGEISQASDFYGETLRRAHAKVDAVWAVVEFMNTEVWLGRREGEWGGGHAGEEVTA